MAAADRIRRYDFVIENRNPQLSTPLRVPSRDRQGVVLHTLYTACTTVGKPIRFKSSCISP